ncbi:hypothetical protein GW17_00056180 [Ensete ventricosum]|nr:hypothetical protein GW17_00056180 [Ensete ventricosum]
MDWPRHTTRTQDGWTGRDTRLGHRTDGLAEIRDSGTGPWTGRDTRLGHRIDGLTEIHDSGAGLMDWRLSVVRSWRALPVHVMGGASRNYALGSSSSTATSVGPARRVWVSLRRAGDPVEEARGAPEPSRKRRGGDSVGQTKKDRRKSPHKVDRATRGKGPADILDEPPALRQRPKSVRKLCSARAGVDGRDYHAIRMCNLPEQASDAPLDPNLRPLTHGTPVWQSGEASTTYI